MRKYLCAAAFSWLVALLLVGQGADVITVTTGTAGASGNTVDDFVNFIYAQLLDIAETNTILDQFAQKIMLPAHAGKTVQFVRQEKLTVSTTALTEGVAPDAVGIQLTTYTATMAQYGMVIRLSDLAELTARHNLVSESVYELGINAAETRDTLIFNVISAATSTYFPNGVAATTALTATDKIQTPDLIELDATLQSNGARPYEGGLYAFVCQHKVHAVLQTDSDWKSAMQFGAPQRIYRGEVGQYAGLRVVRTNSPAFAPDTSNTTGFSDKVYTSFAVGHNAYQVTDLQPLRVYVTPPGTAYDPLYQSWRIGWKMAFQSVITNPNWIIAAFSSGLDSKNA